MIFHFEAKSVKLHIKRRRWTDKNSGKILQRDWNLIAKGTRMTTDFAEFLKKNQPILKHFPAKQLVNSIVLMAESFKDNTKKNISNYKDWAQKSHAEDYVLFPENLSTSLSLDEVALSDGELYSVLTSKQAKGRKGSIVAIIKGTKSETVIDHLFKNK